MRSLPARSAIAMPGAGDVIAGKYAIVRVLGEGGMGVVYEAMHQRLRQRVAIKMLLPAMLPHHVIVSRFDREARAAAQLRGRHIARVSDVDATADGVPYMVMEFLEGHDLQAEIERRGKLPIDEAVDYVLQACAAMAEAHHVGIVHRDLKPSNLFLEIDTSSAPRDARENYIVKVLDFGISKVAPHAEAAEGKLTTADVMLGTAMYMSPEQARQSDAVDGRADIWALGVILYEALSGRVPWLGSATQLAAAIVSEDPPDIRALCDVPLDLAHVIHKALERDPNRRFNDVRELAIALGPYASIGSLGRSFADDAFAAVTRGVDEDPPHRATRTTQSRSRAALVSVLVAFVIGVIVLGGAALFIRSRRPPQAAIGIAQTRASVPQAAAVSVIVPTLPTSSSSPSTAVDVSNISSASKPPPPPPPTHPQGTSRRHQSQRPHPASHPPPPQPHRRRRPFFCDVGASENATPHAQRSSVGYGRRFTTQRVTRRTSSRECNLEQRPQHLRDHE